MANIVSIKLGNIDDSVNLGGSLSGGAAFQLLIENIINRYEDEENKQRIKYGSYVSCLQISTDQDYRYLLDALTELKTATNFAPFAQPEDREIILVALDRLEVWLDKIGHTVINPKKI